MVQIIRHGIGKEDHTYATIKGLPRSDRECKLKFGFDNMLTLRNYEILPLEERKNILNNSLDEIEAYFSTLKWEYLFENKANLITITFLNIPYSESKYYEIAILEIISHIKDKICNLNLVGKKGNNNQETISFHIKNCGFKMDSEGEVQEEVQEKDGEVQEEVQKPRGEVQTKVQNDKKCTRRSTSESTKPSRRSTDESTLKPIDLRLNNEIKALLKEEANNQGLTQYISNLVLKKQHISIECFEKISTILSTKPKKDARIQFKVPSEKKEELQEEAKKKQITLTKHLFQIILHNMKDTRTVKSTSSSTDASTSNQNNHKDPVERLNLKNRKLEAKVEKLQKEKKLLEEILKQMIIPFGEKGILIDFKTDEQAKKIEKIRDEVYK